MARCSIYDMSGDRYHRQKLLPDIGEAGQRALGEARVLIVGCGALGCGVADLLARAGVGTLRIVDRDVVEETNLQRQVLFDQADADASRPKAVAAAERVREINPAITIEAIVDDFRASNAEHIASDMHLLLDGLDNFATRYLLNDLAVKLRIPYIYAGAVGTGGLVMPILPRGGGRSQSIVWDESLTTPCLRCVFPQPPPAGSTPTCDTVGVMGPTIAAVTAQQAAIAMSLIVGRLQGFDRSMHSIDPWRGEDRRTETGAPRDDCPCCKNHIFDWLSGANELHEEALCGRNTVQVLPTGVDSVDLGALAQRLQAHGSVVHADGAVRVDLEQEGVRLTVFEDSRALVGVGDPILARTLYDRFVGS